MSRKKERPGIVLYFDLLSAIDKMEDVLAGELLKAAYRYAKNGEIPTFKTDSQVIIWSLLKERLDADDEHYKEKVRGTEYAVYVREAKKAGEEVLQREEWEQQRNTINSGPL